MEYVLEPSIEFSNGRAVQLQECIQGQVITPVDPDYDEARKAWNLSVDQHPAVIVYAESAVDIAEAVRFARSEGLGVAVQSTGHGNVRPADNCLLIITSRMRDIRVDVHSQTAWVQAGAKWGMVLEKTHPLGLAPLLGSSPDVSVMGYTLGGGMGWLARKYGLATDSVRYFEVVTAEGEIIRASHTENSDLFWGMRGGGGSLGIVTSMEIQLYPVTTVYGGNLFYPVSEAKEVFGRYRDWISSAPDELTSSIVIMNYPPIPELPEFLRGRSFAIVRGCYCGPIEEGEALLGYWRDWQEPIIDDFKTMPFSEVATISNDPVDPLPGLSSGTWLQELTDEVLDTLIRYGVPSEGPPAYLMTEVRHAGGAIARVDPSANAYSHRDAPHSLQVVGITGTPEAYRYLQTYTQSLKRDLERYMMGVYMNWLEGEESRECIQDGFSPEAYRRLRELKAQYDPDNRFSFSFNIQPAD
ncbi:MAG: hypothetical protein AMJ56_02595 [Anaerolineae bacterium SG8_19]|jgi:FAD/FMN-containing dehydrogenase|nr:MAG: hypothetical protein AMJ56_02595 [Anaerolineae bacterium SG8_19]